MGDIIARYVAEGCNHGEDVIRKLFDAHVVYEAQNETPLLYIDRHLVHEVTSRRPLTACAPTAARCASQGKTFATMDHNVSTQTKDINASGEMALSFRCRS